MKILTLKTTLDPHNVFSENNSEDKLKYACGIIPIWAYYSLLKYCEFEKGIIESYGLPCPPFDKKVQADEKGIIKFPGDPDFFPIMTIESDTEFLHIYQHEMLSIVNKANINKQVTYRMD